MIIAVISDLHDNTAAWQLLLREFSTLGIETMINCGDTCAPAMLKEMAGTFSGRIHTIFGNVADRKLEEQVVKDLPNVTHYGDDGDLTLDGQRIFFTHQPAEADRAAASGKYDVVCHGHTHLKRWEKIGECFILNPGTAGGMFQYPSFATIQLPSLDHQFHELTV